MQGDDPPYLSVGTAVSAKYKGAFCEAKVSKVVRVVKCKVTYKMGLGTATVSDEQIKGTLRVGQAVQVKHPDKKEFVDATITKIQDCSQYTVVFDDGDITTLRRTALCLKSGRHFNESETLDQLPLTHPEHFGNPVVGGRRGRRSRQLKEDSSEGEAEEENEPDLELYSADIGRVVSVEASDKKRSKDNWFPGLIVMPSAQPTVRINVKDEFLVRSFKDGRYYTVPKKEVSQFSRELGAKVESTVLAEAVEKAVKYLDHDELPVHWERSSLFNMQSQYSDSEENFTDSSDDEPCEEKDHFVAQLYKFMDDAGTPLNKTPTINNKDVDLYRLFRVVHKLGGYNRVTNQNKWRSVTVRLKFSNNQNTYNQVKLVYKKCLFSYESFYRTLGVTMLNHPRSAKKNRGRSLIRDKDRATPVNNSPRPEKEEPEPEKDDDNNKTQEDKAKVVKKVEEKKRKETPIETSDTNSSDATDHSEPTSSTSTAGRSKRTEKPSKDKKSKQSTPDKLKPATEDNFKKEDKEDDKAQQTRSKSSQPSKAKEPVFPERKRETRTPVRDYAAKSSSVKGIKKADDEKKRGRKRINADDKTSQSDSNNTDLPPANIAVNIGDKLKVYYGPTHESKVTYEAKVIEIDKDSVGPIYLVHYTGWNNRYDEWINPHRIAENLSATTKAKRLKQGVASTSKASTSTGKVATKRGRGMSITGRSTATTEAPRSATPSSVTSSSSRTKSPATPVTRSNRITRQGECSRRTRRTSAHTDASNHSDTDSDISESESESNKTKQSAKSDEGETKTYKKKITKPLFVSKGEKRKDDEDMEKEDDSEKLKKTRKSKKTSDSKSTEGSDDDSTSPPKGRDFDLNQIRSELKGLVKPVKVNTETNEKDAILSDDSTNLPELKETDEVEEDKEEKSPEKSSSSDDIYEFKEPEPFEFETRSKVVDDKSIKKRLVPRLFEDIEKSPKKKPVKSPVKIEPDLEKKRYKRAPGKKQDEDEEEKKEEKKDPFDKLVESPSFHIIKSSENVNENKQKVTKCLNLDEPLSLFRELPDTTEDDSQDRLDISDNEDSPVLFFSKPTLGTVCRDTDTDEYELRLRATIQRVLAQSSLTDEDSNDTLHLNHPTTSYQAKKRDTDDKVSLPMSSSESEENRITLITTVQTKDDSKDVKIDVSPPGGVIKQISPALQETDSTLLDSIRAQPELITTKLEDTKDIKIITGTKIADSLLQKFNMMKNKQSENKICKTEVEKDMKIEIKKETKVEPKFDLNKDDVKIIKPMEIKKTSDVKVKSVVEPKPKTPVKSDVKLKPQNTPKTEVCLTDNKKRSQRKIVSREFIEESDSDSSDSEQLVIARSDDDSQTTSLDNKLDLKESDSNNSNIQQETTDDSQSQQDGCNFKFDDIKKLESPSPQELQIEITHEPETTKEDEPDSHLHSLLLCEETIPGSPAPATENSNASDNCQKPKAILEMPFASAPGSSNSKNLSINIEHSKIVNKEKVQRPPLLPLDNRENRDVSTVLDNTPPTTPESTLSNLSPREENDDLSPTTVDNESWRSTEMEEYSNQQQTLNMKVSLYSEEDTLLNNDTGSTAKKTKEETSVAACKKRRRSCKTSDDVPVKRGRKPLNRSRHNSDSDDTSEHSIPSGTMVSSVIGYDRIARSPRPSKYNFFVELDPSLDSSQRIAVLQQKLSELRKTYADVKAELAAIERRRKKLRRREREAMKAAKQEMACT